MGTGFSRHGLAGLAASVLVVAVAVVVMVVVATGGHSAARSESGLASDSSVDSFISA